MKPMKTSEVWIRIMLMTEIMVQSAEQTFGLFCTFLFWNDILGMYEY